MIELIEANWLAFALALLVGLVVAYWVFGRATSAPKRSHRPDALDEGVAPATRNQALIDAPSAAQTVSVPLAGAGMAGIGEIVAAAAAQEINNSDAINNSEAAAATREIPDLPPNPPAQAPTRAVAGDDLSRIKGVGPKLVALLAGLGVTHYAQIAEWSEGDIDRIDGQLGAFAGRIRRDNWIEQCRYLSAGDSAGFEATFGKL